MGLFNNYDKAGKGVSKDELHKRGFIPFFQILGRKFWSLIKLNLLYILFCLPVITIGPATVGLVKVLKSYTIEKNAFIFEDFWDAFKGSWKTSGIIGLVDIALVILANVATNVYREMAIQSGEKAYLLPLIISAALGVIILMAHFYIYQMIANTQLKLKDVIKNSFILVSVGMKSNLIALLGVILVTAITVVLIILSPGMLLVLPIIVFALIWYIICYCTYPVIEKYVVNPFYEQQGMTNPDYDYLKTDDDNPDTDDAPLFEDNGGNDTPINYKKNKKSKFIS